MALGGEKAASKAALKASNGSGENKKLSALKKGMKIIRRRNGNQWRKNRQHVAQCISEKRGKTWRKSSA